MHLPKIDRFWPWFTFAVTFALLLPRSERPAEPPPIAAAAADDNSADRNAATTNAAAVPTAEADRAPIDLVIAPDESWAVTVNAASGTATLVDLSATAEAAARILDEQPVGELPAAAALLSDGKHVLISAARAKTVTLFAVADRRLARVAEIEVGYEPRGIAVSPDGRTAFVALTAEDKVAVVDLAQRKKTGEIPVGRWPRCVCLSPDGSRLAVACSGGGGIWIVDTATRGVLFEKTFDGLNIGHMTLADDGRAVCFPWTFYGERETSPGSIRLGWVMASRLGTVAFDEQTEPRGLSLDPRGDAVADVHGFDLSADGKRAVAAAGGTHELLVLRADDLPWLGIGGSEHMDRELARDRDRFARIPLGGRPLGVRLSRDANKAYVVNDLRNSIQIVDLAAGNVATEIALGGPTEPQTPERRGFALFHDAHRCLENWYSCHTCHFDGGPNAETIDTFNDGSSGTYKSVPSLVHVADTGPWTWHGRRDDLHDSIANSFVTTMRGPRPTAEETTDLVAYLNTLRPLPNPHRADDGKLSAAAERGKAVFHSAAAGCADCHGGPLFTDGENHDVGLGRKSDRYADFNTPSLVDVQRRIRLLHDGRVRTLEKLLTGPHSPAKVSGQGELSDEQRADLIAYLLTL